MNDEEFKISHFRKGDLAQRYFPHSSRKTAVRHLMRWVTHCRPLMTELRQTGYKGGEQWFTGEQVRLIVRHLAEP